MRRRRLLLGAGVLTLLGLTVIWLTLPHPGVTWANYERIQDGMTLEEVRGILGGEGEKGLAHEPGLVYDDQRVWVEGDLGIVTFFRSGRLVRKDAFALNPPLPAPTFWDRLRRLLPW